LRRVHRVTQLGFAAAADALADAGELHADPARCSVVAGTGMGGMLTLHDMKQTFTENGVDRISPHVIPLVMPNATAATASCSARAPRSFSWRVGHGRRNAALVCTGRSPATVATPTRTILPFLHPTARVQPPVCGWRLPTLASTLRTLATSARTERPRH
jgi:hypothetical protein